LKPAINILIRDDDICYFTKSNLLERIYKLLLELSLPINLAVILLVDLECTEPIIG